jgi:tetratricopeptide (TPR) repeat protein
MHAYSHIPGKSRWSAIPPAPKYGCTHTYIHTYIHTCIHTHTYQDKVGEARCLTHLGLVNFDRGETISCTRCLEEALALCKQSVQGFTEADCLLNIGDVMWRLGDYEETKAHYQLALRICKEQMDRAGEARALCGIAQVCLNCVCVCVLMYVKSRQARG